MESIKKHIIFDLDDTIWDYQHNSNEALKEIYSSFEIEEHGVTNENFIHTFGIVNNHLWDEFDKGAITRDIIRRDRFPMVFDKLSINLNGVAMQMQDSFMQICSSKPSLVNGVQKVLDTFKSKYSFHILSNGFDQIQFVKLKAAGVEHYFDKVITSGRAGFRKPQPEIFEFALNEIGATKEECIMIGDNPLSDIEGAHAYGIDQVYYNVHNKECAINPTYTIYDFNELLKIL